MNVTGLKSWAHDFGTMFHIIKPNELDIAATETVIKSAAGGIAPTTEEATHLVELAGNKIGGIHVDPGTIFDGAPKTGDDLFKNIGDAVKSGFNNMVLNWKDAHFPQKLDAALAKQDKVISDMRKVEASFDVQLIAIGKSKDTLTETIKGIDGQIESATKAGNTDLASKLTIQKNGAVAKLANMDTEFQLASKGKSDFDTQLTQLEVKSKIDASSAIELKAKWDRNRALKDMPAEIQDSYNSMIDLGADADRINRDLSQRAQATQTAIDEALKHDVPT